jgi:predicted nucleic acid-binding protein
LSGIYVDASALMRVVLAQQGVKAPTGPGKPLSSSRIVEVEGHRAIDRLRLLGELNDTEAAAKTKQLIDVVARINLIPVSDSVIELARASFPVGVRALDAIHVASAQVLKAEVGEIEFWTHDRRQADAALSRGLEVRGLETPATAE